MWSQTIGGRAGYARMSALRLRAALRPSVVLANDRDPNILGKHMNGKVSRLLRLLSLSSLLLCAAALAQPEMPAGGPDALDAAAATAVPESATAAAASAGAALAPAPAGDGGSAGAEPTADPWHGFNYRVHRVNRGIDKYFFRPIAKGYVKVVPRPIRFFISNFFTNLFQPLTAAHQLLQGKPGEAASSLGRFSLNIVAGVGGIFDPASDAKIPLRQEDLGQTLAVWGWKESNYLVLPFFGPGTLRDGFGVIGDSFANPIRFLDDDETRYGLQALYLVDFRASLLPTDRFTKDAEDDYLFFRDAYLQRRKFQISDGRDSVPDYLLDEDLYEDFEDENGQPAPLEGDGHNE